jgi:DNA polymerase-3 subunit epsilon
MNRKSSGGDIESLAVEVGQHPDYRVLRRLDTSVEYPSLSGPDVSRAVILDTETTGLEPGTDKVIELGLVVFEYGRESGRVGRVLDTYNALEDPGMEIPPASTAVHGITDEMVAGKHFDEAAIQKTMSGVAIVIAHNADFDRRFVEERFPAFVSLPWGCSLKEIPWDEAGIGSAKLDYLAYQHGFFYDGHRAEMDCRALLEILRRPVATAWGGKSAVGGVAARERRASSSGLRVEEGSNVTALKTLLDRAREPSYRVWATGSPFETKDVLKARQYRWDPEARCWWRELGAGDLEAEFAWLKTAVYAGRSAAVDVDALDARVRFSARAGKRERRLL